MGLSLDAMGSREDANLEALCVAKIDFREVIGEHFLSRKRNQKSAKHRG